MNLTAVPSDGLEFGGWSQDVQDVVNPVEVKVSDALTVGALFFSGSSCVDDQNSDVFGDLLVDTTHPIGSQAYGCMIVDEADGFPVVDGSQTARFEVREGDCSGNDGFDDCVNDRSRHEINEIMSNNLKGNPSDTTGRPHAFL